MTTFDSGIRFDSNSLTSEITPYSTVEEVVASIENKSGKKFKHKIISANVVQMVGNIFNFFDYTRDKLSTDIVKASIYARRMKR